LPIIWAFAVAILFVNIHAFDDFDFDSLKEKQFARRRMRKSNNDSGFAVQENRCERPGDVQTF
jgi:hypothetical protein